MEQGPKQPLEEKDALIERLRAQLEAVTNAACVYLANSTPINALKLHDALKQARGEKQG